MRICSKTVFKQIQFKYIVINNRKYGFCSQYSSLFKNNFYKSKLKSGSFSEHATLKQALKLTFKIVEEY